MKDMKLRLKHSIQLSTECQLATMQKETSSIQKVSILILRNGSQDMTHSAKSGSVNMLLLKSASSLIRSRSQRQRQLKKLLLKLQLLQHRHQLLNHMLHQLPLLDL